MIKFDKVNNNIEVVNNLDQLYKYNFQKRIVNTFIIIFIVDSRKRIKFIKYILIKKVINIVKT